MQTSAEPDGRDGLHAISQQRKRAEEDVQLLANRLKLLKAEEERTRKKAADVVEQTQKMRSIRERREKENARKYELLAEKEARMLAERSSTLRTKEVKLHEIREKREGKARQNLLMARSDRDARSEALQRAQAVDDSQKQQLKIRAGYARRKEFEAQHVRAVVQVQKREEVKKLHEERELEHERRLTTAVEKLAAMEAEELQVLSRLQHSQRVFENACAEYREAKQSSTPALPPPAATPLDTRRPPLARRLTPRESREVCDAHVAPRASSVPSTRRTPSTACSDSTPKQRKSEPFEAADSISVPTPAPEPVPVAVPPAQKMITYTTMDGLTVSIPAPDGADVLDLAEDLNAR